MFALLQAELMTTVHLNAGKRADYRGKAGLAKSSDVFAFQAVL